MPYIRKRWFSACLVLLSLITVSIVFAQDSEIAPPKVIDTNPIAGEELSLNGEIRFTFDRPMNPNATDNRFSITPDLGGGEWQWENDLNLRYIPPTEGYARDTLYTFSVVAADTEGRLMEAPYMLQLQTVGYIEISEILPADGTTEIDTDAVITVLFNRPIVPLVNTPDMEALPNPVIINPPTAGTGEWLNTSIYTFTPEVGLMGGTTYTVTIDPNLTSLNGAILQEAYGVTFSTARPIVTNVQPRDGATKVQLNPTIEVTFSQAINSTTQNGIYLEGNNGLRPDLNYEWSEDGRRVSIKPVDLLELDTLYDLFIDNTVVKSRTGAFLTDSYQYSFQTVPYPAIVRTSPANGDGDASPYGGMTIYFNAPVDLKTLEGKITIDPEPWRDFETYYYDYSSQYTLYFDTEPSTDYTVTIASGIADPYGNTINETRVIRYRTAAYGPDFIINVPSTVGVYNAYNANTRLFINHLNVSALDIELYKSDVRTAARFTGPRSWEFRDSFNPSPNDLLRSWSIPVQAQENRRRYELVLLSTEGGTSVECLGAPISRLQIGLQAKVSEDDPRPLNVRSEPTTSGSVVTQFEPGVVFGIRNGPVCADGFLWWEIFEPASNVGGWIAEGTPDLYFVEPVGAIPPSNDILESPPLPKGIYYLEVNTPETRRYDYDTTQEHMLIISTAAITLKNSRDQMLAWITDIQSGLPLVNIPVNFYDSSFGLIGRANTDENGLAQINIPQLSTLDTIVYAVVETEEHFAFVTNNFNEGISPWQFGLYMDSSPADHTIYMYTDRPIYRPDQPVYFRGVLRNVNDVTYSVDQSRVSLPVLVYDSEGQVVYEDEVVLTPNGTFSGQFDIASEATLGYYRIEVALSEAWEDRFGVGFNVAEYRAPEYQVTLTPAITEVVQGDTIQVAVEGRYFFGAPVSNADVTWEVIGYDYYFNYTGDGWYNFFDYSYDEGASEYYYPSERQVANGTGTTDDEGIFLLELPAELSDRNRSQRYSIEAILTDESDQVVASRTQVIVHQGEVYVGISPEDYVITSGEEGAFNVISVDLQSEIVPNQVVDYRIVERIWSSVQEKDELGRTVWRYEVEEIEAATGNVTTDAEGMARIAFTPQTSGTYKAYATTRDSRGNEVRSSAYVWVSGPEYVPWRQQNSNRIDLISDADSYTVGDTAEILIASPFQGETYALITVERGDIMTYEVVRMESNSYVYRLPIEDIHVPNVFVSVILVKGVDETAPYSQFRVGMIGLAVDTERLVMNVDVTADLGENEFAGPGDTVKLNIKTTDWQGNPVAAEVGVGVTDLAVLTIAPPNSGTLLQHFYSQRGVTVNTANTLTRSVDQLTQTIIDTIKGGGGGGPEGGIFDVRQEFVDTPLWAPEVVTDANGVGEVSVILPDNLTTWRIDARAISIDPNQPLLVGQTTADFISTKPLLIRPITPRFMIVGDRLTLGAIVNNNTSVEQTVTVFIEGTGYLMLDNQPTAQTVTIPAGGRARVNWQVQALDVEFVDVFFAVQNADQSLTDASKPTLGLGDEQLLPVYKYVVPENVGTAGTLEEDNAASRTEFIVLPERIDATQGQLTIKLERSLAAPILDGLSYLRNYPYQCVEQTVSRFLPNVITMRALTELNQSNPTLEENLRIQVNYGIQRLYADQKMDGGWGWFPRDPSNPLTTAYALIGLVEAKKSGFAVDDRVIQRAQGFLRSYVAQGEERVRVNTAETWELNRRAFVLYALARSGETNVSRLSSLYDVRERLSLDAKAYLTMALIVVDPTDPRLETLMSDFVSSASLSATGTSWHEQYRDYYNWTTDTRTTALILMAMTQYDASNDLLPGAVRWLIIARQGDYWETTQETAWAVMAFTDWMSATRELEANYTFNAILNGENLPIVNNVATPDNVKESETLRVEIADLLRDEANRLTIVKGEGEGNLYYTAQLRTFLDVPSVEPVDRGILITRQYSLLDDEEGTPITGGRVGDEVLVTLTIIAPKPLHYVVIEDPIPAGAESIDTTLLTTPQSSQGPRLQRQRRYGTGWGWWYFSRTEFRDEKVVLYATYLRSGTYTFTYTLRLGLAGEYNVIPTTGFEFYFPEVYGRSDGMLFTIEPAPESDLQ